MRMKFYKKIFTAVISASLLVIPVNTVPQTALTASADYYQGKYVEPPFEVDGMFFQEIPFESGELALVDYQGDDENLVIPETVNGMTVTSIARKYPFLKSRDDVPKCIDASFFENNTIKTVTIPETVDNFSSSIFYNCPNLVSVNIPKAVRVIPDSCFSECPNLKEIEFHDNLICISSTAFQNTPVNIPNDIYIYTAPSNIYNVNLTASYDKTGIDNKVMWFFSIIEKSNDEWDYEIIADTKGNYYVSLKNCLLDTAETVTVPEEFDKLPIKQLSSCCDIKSRPLGLNSVISKCKNLKTLIINANDVVLDKNSLSDSTLKTLVLGENCNKISLNRDRFISEDVFKNSSLTHIESKGDLNVGENTFKDCTRLKTVEINGNLKTGISAFQGCTELKELTIAGSSDLATYAFLQCSKLKNININTDYGIMGTAFNGCSSLMNINSQPVFDSETGGFNPEISDYIFRNFNACDNVGFINEYIKAQVRKVVNENTSDDMTDLQKARILHDWVCQHTEYNYTDGAQCHNDGSVFLNDSTQCDGYTKAYNLLLHEAGIESYCVKSTNHTWNIIKLGGEWFHVDSTWDDVEENYNWFLKTDEDFKNAGGHHAKWTMKSLSDLHGTQPDKAPECTQKMGDVNADSDVSIADSVLILQSIANPDKYKLSELAEITGDVYNTGDGITATDALSIQKKEAKIIEYLPEIS